MPHRSAIRALALICALAATPATSSATVLPVAGDANVFGAGHAAPPEPGGGGAGTLPPMHAFAAEPGKLLIFSDVYGGVSCCGDLQFAGNGADGSVHGSGTTDILSYGGISGVIADDRTMFLVGVFTDGTEPSDPGPAILDFSPSGLGTSFASLAPALDQVFFVGDGKTGTGSGELQQFHVPPTATRLYLGFADAENFGNPTSAPGFYENNNGELLAVFEITSISTASRASSWGRLKLLYR
jgi:hypothetical protein